VCALALAIGALLLVACGGGSSQAAFKKSGPPPPQQCLERWNSDEEALAAGKHAYSPGHDSRAARVTLEDLPQEQLENVCMVIFAASRSDREYGILGNYSTAAKPTRDSSGLIQGVWQPITYLPVNSEQERLQRQRSGEMANSGLSQDGKLEPLK
jgi:hypothetical protein